MSRVDEALKRAGGNAREWTGRPDALSAGAPDGLAAVLASQPAADVDDYCSEEEIAAAAAVAEMSAEEVRDLPRVGPDPVRPTAAPPAGPCNEKLIVSEFAQPIVVEQYRKLAATLHQVQVERESKIVMVASAMAGEGKTLTAANLALTLSESFRRRVLLVDADLRRPTVHQLFQIANDVGLNDALAADEERKLALIDVSPRLKVLPAGRPNPDPMSGLTSDRMRRILDEASTRFEWVVVDTPPIGLLPDAELLARMVNMVVFVIGAGSTPYSMVERAVNAIDRSRIVGVVLNRATEAHAAYQYYSYCTSAADRG